MLREPLQESSWTLDTSGAAFRSGVEKSEFFARWLIGTFTTVGDAVLDCLVGCGSMATECKRLHRHCISIEKDVVIFKEENSRKSSEESSPVRKEQERRGRLHSYKQDIKLGRDGSTKAKHRYHKQRVTETESDTKNVTEVSDHSRWRMDTGKTSRRKEKPIRHRSGTLDGHYKRDRGPDLKIACPIFKGKKHDDPDVHIQAFEQYAELKHIME
ncbi:hypothetical protein L7F22_023206 [Adiantum nelumboides]|nr:hypothetical protein [Adiantum nelumboides]